MLKIRGIDDVTEIAPSEQIVNDKMIMKMTQAIEIPNWACLAWQQVQLLNNSAHKLFIKKNGRASGAFQIKEGFEKNDYSFSFAKYD